MKKERLLILLVIAIFIIIFLLAYMQTLKLPLEGVSNINNRVPGEVKQVADQFVMGIVGKSEFDKNYRIDYEKSQDCRDAVYGCDIVYRFLPGEKYGGSEYHLYYIDQSIQNFPPALPSCEKDINNCNFMLSLDDLKGIAKREDLDDNYFTMIMRSDQKILIEASYCDLNTMENRRKILIDPINGEVVWRGPNRECVGIF